MGWVSWLWGDCDGDRTSYEGSVCPPATYSVPCALGNADIVVCSGCGKACNKCKCDPELGRPAKWWEC